MKSNLKKQIEDMGAGFANEINRLLKRVHNLEEKLDTYLVPRFQWMDKTIVELQTSNKFLTGMQNAIMKLEEWRDRQNQCGGCKWVTITQNEDQQNIGVCDNPNSIQYRKEVLAEENCPHFSTKPEIVVEELEEDSK